MFRANPTEFPFIGTIGMLSFSSIVFLSNFSILPTLVVVFTEIIIISLIFRFSILLVFSSPKISGKSSYFIFIFSFMSGSFPGFEAMFPERKSDFVNMLSNSVSKESEPPGIALSILVVPLYIDFILVFKI